MEKKGLLLALIFIFSSNAKAFNVSSCWDDMRAVGAYGLGIGMVFSLADHAMNKFDVPKSRTEAFLIGLPVASAAFAFVVDTPCSVNNTSYNNQKIVPFVSANEEIGISFYKTF